MTGFATPSFGSPKFSPPMLGAAQGFGNEEPAGLLNTYTQVLLQRPSALTVDAVTQGVAYDGTYYYLSVNEKLYKYSFDEENGAFTEELSRSVATDGDASRKQINGMDYHDGSLWIGGNNFNDVPEKGWVLQYDPSDLTLLNEYSVDAHYCEGGAWHDVGDGYQFWAVFHDWDRVSRYEFGPGWAKVDDYLLPGIEGQSTNLCQDATWIGDHIITPLHGSNSNSKIHVHVWNGAGFNAVQALDQLAPGWQAQGLHWETTTDPEDGDVLLFADRPTDRIIRVLWMNEDLGGSAGVVDSFSGALSGYAMTRENSKWAGHALYVQRDSDNARSIIRFSGDYLDTDALLTFAGASNVDVIHVPNQFVNAPQRHLTQFAAAARPRIVNAGALVTMTNGAPAMDFSGAKYMVVHGGMDNPASDYVIAAAAKTTTANDDRAYLLASESPVFLIAFRNDSNIFGYYDGAWRGFTTRITGDHIFDWFLKEGAGNAEGFVDGISDGVSTYIARSIPAGDALSVGARPPSYFNFNGLIGALFIYTYSTIDRAALDASLKGRYVD